MNAITNQQAYLSGSNRYSVTWGDCDAAAIVFYARYYAWFDASTHHMLEAVGLGHRSLQEHYKVVGLPLVTAHASFHAPATYGDVLRADCWIAELGRSRIVVHHTLHLGDTLVVRGEEVRVWAARNADDPSQLRSVPIPAEVRSILQGGQPSRVSAPEASLST